MTIDPSRRRLPRRKFKVCVGILHSGEYSVEYTHQIGEGGLGLLTDRPLGIDAHLIVTVQIPEGSLICTRGSVRFIEPMDASSLIGIQFDNLDFNLKRELRNFVASATTETSEADETSRASR